MSHYKPYLAYKDSGVEWLGRVPEHWTLGPYKAMIQIENGSDYKEVEVNDGYPVIGSGGPFAFSSKLMYEGESVLLGRKGTIDKPLYVSGAFWAVDTMYWSIIKPGTHARFAYYIATTIPFDLYSTNTALPSMTKSVLGSHIVAFPGFVEQQSIAAHLDCETVRIDALIKKKTRFIELLREKRQALITHAVTKGLNPSVKMKDSGVEWLGEVPEHWVVKRLKFIANVQTGIAKGKDNADKDTVEVPYLRVANVQDGYLDLDNIATIEVSSSDIARYLLQPGDVLMNEGGDFDKLGRGHVWQGEIDPCIHQNHVFAVRPHGVLSEWLNTVSSSEFAQFYFMGRSKQSTNLASISSTNLMELPVPLPSKSEQLLTLEKLRDRTSRLDALMSKTKHSIDLLKERRSALITAAVTGQIDLREAV